MKYLLILLLLISCGVEKKEHLLQVKAGYQDETLEYGPVFSDGIGGSFTFLYHDKKHNRYDTIIVEVKRQKQ